MKLQQRSEGTVYSLGGVCFRYRASGNGEDRWVLDHLSFDLPSGETLAIIGPNGSGKSTLLKLLAGLLPPTQGHIALLGRPLAELRPEALARLVAFVPQASTIVFPVTVRELVLMGRYPYRSHGWNLPGMAWETAEDHRVALEAMQVLDVDHLAERAVRELSGGELQRVVIARALAQQPSVLLLDEPTAFLDLNHQLDICRVLRQLNAAGRVTVVLVSHDLNLASQYCDRVLMLAQGRLAGLGTPEEVIGSQELERVYGCEVLVDRHPGTGRPRVTLPGPT